MKWVEQKIQTPEMVAAEAGVRLWTAAAGDGGALVGSVVRGKVPGLVGEYRHVIQLSYDPQGEPRPVEPVEPPPVRFPTLEELFLFLQAAGPPGRAFMWMVVTDPEQLQVRDAPVRGIRLQEVGVPAEVLGVARG